jgi:hypothetical protein
VKLSGINAVYIRIETEYILSKFLTTNNNKENIYILDKKTIRQMLTYMDYMYYLNIFWSKLQTQ